jgi:hypothetical protein
MIRKSLITSEMRGLPTIQEKKEEKEKIIQKYQHSGMVHDIYRKIAK